MRSTDSRGGVGAVVEASRNYKRYLLTLLLVILAFNYVERQALGLLSQDIKLDLALSDAQLGLLGGIGFALFYSLTGIPIARWADRGNRVVIIAITTATWSTAMAVSAATVTFLQLLLVRVGVAVGKAGCIPAAHSLIADHFSRSERPRALAVYMLGGPLSMLFGYLLAGWLNEVYGWRMAFALLGLPGLLLAAVAWLTLKDLRAVKSTQAVNLREESVRGALSTDAASPAQPSIRDVCKILWANGTFRHLLFGFTWVSFVGYASTQWQPMFFIRSYGLQTGELGAWLAAIYGVGGLVGTYLGGELASRYAAEQEHLQLKGIGAAYLGFGVLSVFVYLSSSQSAALGLMGLACILLAGATGPLFATMQTLVPPDLRAMSIAAVYLVANLIGMGLGPLAAGLLSDELQPIVGDESIRYALLMLSPCYVWAAWHLWRASGTVGRDLANSL